MNDLLRDVLDHLRDIQSQRKGSIGSLNNVYLPQLDVDRVDALVTKVAEACRIAQGVMADMP